MKHFLCGPKWLYLLSMMMINKKKQVSLHTLQTVFFVSILSSILSVEAEVFYFGVHIVTNL